MHHVGVGETGRDHLDLSLPGRHPLGPRVPKAGQRVGPGPGDDRDRHRRAILLDTMTFPAPDPGPWIVIYDGDCGLCATLLALLLRLDRHRRLRSLALGTPAADALLSDLSAAERGASW